jgi:hypothetical protein
VPVSDRPFHIGSRKDASISATCGGMNSNLSSLMWSTNRLAANEGGLVALVDGDGNGGNPFIGADAVGLKCSRFTNEYLKK